MTSNNPLGARAYEHVRQLAQEIGPRPAGSAAERQALDYIHAQLTHSGYAVERLPVPYAPLPTFAPLYVLGGLLLALGSWFATRYPWVTVWLPLLSASLPQIARWLFPLRHRTAQSQNLVAYTAAPANAPTLILCAHVDSARAKTFRNPLLLWLQNRSMYFFQRVAVLVSVLAALKLVGIDLPPWVDLVVGFAGLGVGGWLVLSELLNQFAHRGRYSPGAHDNASGVGVVLALAQEFAPRAPTNIRLGFLFTGAEETGLHGTRAFVEHQETSSSGPLLALCLDMVGAGDQLRIVTHDGTIFARRTDRQLNELLWQVYPQAQGLWYTQRSGDHLAFLRGGVRASALQTSGSARAELAYHTVHDTLDLIQQPTLEMVAQVVRQVVESIAAAES